MIDFTFTALLLKHRYEPESELSSVIGVGEVCFGDFRSFRGEPDSGVSHSDSEDVPESSASMTSSLISILNLC